MTKVLQCDREAAEALDDALGFLTNNERPIVEKHLARHREEAQAELLEALSYAQVALEGAGNIAGAPIALDRVNRAIINTKDAQ